MAHKKATKRLGTHKLCRPHCGKSHRHYKAVGSRAQVWHGTAKHTSGGLMRKDLVKNKWGRIVSLEKHLAKKESPLPPEFKKYQFSRKLAKSRATRKRKAARV